MSKRPKINPLSLIAFTTGTGALMLLPLVGCCSHRPATVAAVIVLGGIGSGERTPESLSSTGM